jgi:GNAT superfamily N-acetyltransferase
VWRRSRFVIPNLLTLGTHAAYGLTIWREHVTHTIPMAAQANQDCSGPPHPIFVAVASPACPDHWARATHIIDGYISWVEQAIGVDLTAYRHENQAELAALQDYYSWPTGQLLVGVLDGRIVGVTGVKMLEPGVAELRRMYVAPEGRGHGIAPMMLRSAIRVSRQLGAETLRLETLPWLMKDAVRMYLRAGFVPIQHYSAIETQAEGSIAMELRVAEVRELRAAS